MIVSNRIIFFLNRLVNLIYKTDMNLMLGGLKVFSVLYKFKRFN